VIHENRNGKELWCSELSLAIVPGSAFWDIKDHHGEVVLFCVFWVFFYCVDSYVWTSVPLIWFAVGGVKKKAATPTGEEPENKRQK